MRWTGCRRHWRGCGHPLSADSTFKPSPEGVRILKAAAERIQELRRDCQRQRRELAEARAALLDVLNNQPSKYIEVVGKHAWDYGSWMAKHATVLNAAREAK